MSLFTASLKAIIENRERSTEMLTAYAGNARNVRILNRTTSIIIVKTKRRMIRTLFMVKRVDGKLRRPGYFRAFYGKLVY